MNHGFLIDTSSCIGCHACSVACKSENQVPLGVHRTWVKVTESGAFPNTRRDFQVTRCNHCSNPPCVAICPVTAMIQRPDGIVEFDGDACIGCKACMQACPYDAIHIDPETHTAAKCHFCAHRIEQQLEPACVVVCPTHSIIAGDLDNPNSEIRQVMARKSVTVRKPEQGTEPKLFYVEGSHVALNPAAFSIETSEGLFSQAPDPETGLVEDPYVQKEFGPIQIQSGRMAEQMVQVAHRVDHKMPWHWPVPAYLVTKGLGSGLWLLLSLAMLTDSLPAGGMLAVWGGALATVGLLATTALLVLDLDRPERFLRILTRPQWKSWLVKGAFILVGLSTVTGVWLGLELGTSIGWWEAAAVEPLRTPLAWLTLPLSIGGAIYTAFLFAQCEGRDLWQSPLLGPHLLVQALMMGAVGLILLGLLGVGGPWVTAGPEILLGTLIADLIMLFGGEFALRHPTEVSARAAKDITHGRYKHLFWLDAIGIGHLIPLALIGLGGDLALGVAAVCTTVGLFAYEYAFVMAPQRVPNS
jgi:Fe-S-cluster-containing dehydrogenase component/formate-dependent nitrite reductase membrane component NrfD